MYKITIQTLTGDEHTIYVPGNEDYVVTSAVLSLSVGSVGEFNFTIPLGHPRYNEIVDHSIVTIYEDNAEIWRGEIRDIKQNFDKSLNVYCLEDMCWLGECAVAMTSITNQTYAQRFSAAIATYNTNQVAKRQFTAGQLTSITTTNMCTWQPQYEEDLLTCLRNYIADDGYVRIRREYSGGVLTRYVDIVKLSDYGSQADQKIEFGSNLLDFVKEMDDTNFLNVIYPYGKETETPLYGEIMQRTVGTPQENAASIAAFGRRERSVIFETDSLARLNSLAQSYLNRYSQPNMKLEVRAVDLGNIEVVNRIHLGDSVRIIASTFGIDQWSYATKQELNLLDIADNQITLADDVRVQSLTSQVAEQAKEIEKAQTPASILDEAKRNAWAIFEGDNGGIVTFDVNGSEQIVGIHIANNLDIDQATKAWGWNLNGLVYMHRDYPTDNWQIGIAMNMNGEIVADYITTGNLNADLLKAGTITIGGSGYANQPTLLVKDTGNNTIGSWTKDGISITGGSINITGYAKTSDIPDVSDYATKTGLATQNYTTINGGNITTGYISAQRIKGDTLELGGSNNTNGQMVVKDASGTTIVTANNDGIVTTHLTATDDSKFGNLNIGKKNVVTPLGEQLMSYVYGEGWIEYWYEDWEGALPKSQKKIIYFSPYYDGWAGDYDVDVQFRATDEDWEESHDNKVVCQAVLSRYTGTGWSTVKTLKLNYDGDDINDQDPYFDNFTANDKTIYRLQVTIKKYNWAEDYFIDICTTYAHIFELNPYEMTGSFRGHLDGSASLYSLSVNDVSITQGGSIVFDDEETRRSYSIKSGGYESSDGYGSDSSSDGSIKIQSDDHPSIYIKKANDSKNYIRIHTDDPTIKVSDGSYENIEITTDLFQAFGSSSRYTIIDNTSPSLTINTSSNKYISISNSEMRLQLDSSNYCRISRLVLDANYDGATYYINWTQGSDERIKDDIESLDTELSRKLIDATETKKFRYKNEEGKHYGMIAQEARKVLDSLGETDALLEYGPNIEDENVPNYRAIHYEEYIPHLINYVKDLRAEIEALKNIINTLKEDK